MMTSCNNHTYYTSTILYPQNYYKNRIQELRNFIKDNDLKESNFFYFHFGIFNIVITKEQGYYLAKTTIKSEENISITYTDKFELSNKPIKGLFSYINDKPILYDKRKISYLASYETLALVDSLGNIKILANQETLIPTRKFYKDKLHKEIPLTKEQGDLIFHLTFYRIFQIQRKR